MSSGKIALTLQMVTPDLGKAIVRAMDRLKQQNLQARNELSQLIAQCKERQS